MDESKYRIQNEKVVGQVVGDNATIHQYFYDSDAQAHFASASERLWSVPYERNPLFTGREEILTQLHQKLTTSYKTALTQSQAINGLGGIGKTQIAIEYAYRFQNDYQFTLWVNAQTRDTLLTGFITLADLFHLPQPETDEQYQSLLIKRVKQWFTQHDRWLLILDNADGLSIINEFYPTGSTGHILLTTRENATGPIPSINVEKMLEPEAVKFLLRRANILKSEAPLEQFSKEYLIQAALIVQTLDGLPLALDQVGAYIEETECSLTDYLELYKTRRNLLLKERGNFALGHPESVATTFSLVFQKVQESSPSAADIIRLCAFLHSEEIPEEIFVENTSRFDSSLQSVVANQFDLNAALKLLLRFSLVRRDSHFKLLSIHRLVQAVVQDEMDESEQRRWAELSVRYVSRLFPFANPQVWQQCQRLLLHAYTCAGLIDHWHLNRIEATGLLYRIGLYLFDRAVYSEVDSYYQQALSIVKEAEDSESSDIASILTAMGQLYERQGNYGQAMTIQQEALEIRLKIFGEEHLRVADSLYNLANIYSDQGKDIQAESLYLKALEIRQKLLGSKHPEVGAVFNNLGLLYATQEKYEKAEPFLRQSLEIKQQGAEDVNLSSTLSNLANILRTQGKFAEAEELSQYALTIIEKLEGPKHPDVAPRSNNLALIYYDEGKLTEAELLFKRAIEIDEEVLGKDHPNVANALSNLAALYIAQQKFDEAESLFKRALAIWESRLGPMYPKVATTLSNLALCYFYQGKLEQAELFFKQAIKAWEQIDRTSNNLETLMYNYASLLYIMRRDSEATVFETKAKAIRMEIQQFSLSANKQVRKSERISAVRPYKKRPKKNALR